MKIRFLFVFIILVTTSCGFKVTSVGSHTGNVISGIISPFVGSITENDSSLFIISSATASPCADPVYAKLFGIKNDGAIDENNPLSTQLIGPDARYSFDIKTLGLSKPSLNVQYLVKAEGCNGDVYKRPITNFDNKQHIDAKSTVIAEVINANSLITKQLNQASRSEVELLINSVSGSSTSAALNSLTSEATNSTMFTQIFGASPSIIHDASPEVKLIMPSGFANELAVSNFSIQAFHVDPAYSFAYSWKIDGVVKSTSASWNYIPGANDSGDHTITLYVGKNDGSGNIDLGKPYFAKSVGITVNNNILPTPPNISINAGTPGPRNINTVSIDLATGISLGNCASFSHLAMTDTSNIPGILQFNIDCHANGTQTENVTFPIGDGAKTIYLWAIDNEGNISNPKTVSLVLDTLPPSASLNIATTNLRGGTTQTLTLSASDAGVGLNTLDLYFSADNGGTYSLVSSLSNSATSYSWSVPSINTINGKLKLVATDLTSSATSVYSSNFVIDSTAPSAPTISRTSNVIANSTTVGISTTCIVDYDKIIYSEISSTPALTNLAWEACANTKSFTASSGEGLKTIYAFTRDTVGNISSVSNITMTLDTISPALSLTSFNAGGYFQGGSLQNITWTASDTNIAANPISISYSTDGTTYTSIASNIINSGSYAWTLPSLNNATVTLKISATDLATNVKTIISNNFVIDSTAPAVAITDPSGSTRGATAITLNYSASDTNTISSLKLYFAADGVTYGSATNLTVGSTTYSWSAPSLNVTTAKIKIEATDNAGNVGTGITNAFTIDSTAPSAPTIARTSSAISSSTTVALSATCTADYDKIYYSQTSTTPTLSDPAWETCASTKNFTISTGDGLKTIYAFTRDLVGNISTSANVALTLDTTPPTLALTSMNVGGYFKGGSSQNITWTASDTNIAANPITLAYSINGTTYTSIATNITNNGTYSWTLPSIDNATVTLKITAVDSAGNLASAVSNNLAIDSTAPSVAITTPSGPLIGGSTITLNYSATDTNTISSLQLAYASDGVTFGAPTSLTVGSVSVSWSIPSNNLATSKLKLIATDVTGNIGIAVTNAFTIDSTAPTAPTIARTSAATSNSTTVAISATCIADYDKIYYSQTSTTPAVNDVNWETCNATKNFTASTGDGLKTIYAFSKDVAGNISTSANITMTLDTAPPSAPVANLASANINSSSTTSFTVTDCLDRPYVLVSESAITPLVGDTNWQVCSTSAGAINYILVGPILQGSHTLYVYAKDAVGNISASTTASMIYDTTNPTLNLSTVLGSLYKGGDTVALNFTTSDTNGLSSFKLEYAADGSTYSLVSALATNASAYTWTVPSNNTATAKIRLIAIDNATSANSATVYSTVFTIDSIAPTAPTIARGSAQYSQLNAVTINTTCIADYYQILYTETSTTPSLANSNWETCGAMKIFSTSASDGLKTIYGFTRDLVGNISSSSNVAMTLDTTLPALSLTSFNSGGYFQGGTSQNITWTATDANLTTTPISILYSTDGVTYTSLVSNTANTGTYSWSLPLIDNVTVTLKIIASDLAGNIKTVISNNFTIEKTNPTLNSFSITEGANTAVQNIRINLTASNSVTKITQFCIKVNSNSQPTADDPCWKAVDATPPGIAQATSITISNFYYQLGFTTGNYTLYAFVKNQSDLISSLSNSGSGTDATDMASIYFISPQPPVVANIIASNTDSPSNPVNSSEYSITAGANVYIKWKATDSVGFGANPITIEYTTNGTTYTQIATNLLNGSNGACSVDNAGTTLDDGNTGCYIWSGTSLGTFFAIRVRATNSGAVSSSAQSAPMNSGNVNIIAGNTDVGLNGSAKSAMISIKNNGAVPKVQQFIVMPDGVIVAIDSLFGIGKIDPSSGIYSIIIPNGATTSNQGDGGPISSAKVKSPNKIILAFDNNIYLWDEIRVRKITTSTNPWTITTAIGGGATVSGSSVNGTSLLLSDPGSAANYPFVARPDGTILFIPNNFGYAFNNANPPRVYSYSVATGLASFVGAFSGVGDSSNATKDLYTSGRGFYSGAGISFDKINSNIKSVLGCLSLPTGDCASTRFNPNTFIASQSDSNAYPYSSAVNTTTSFVTGMDGVLYAVDSGGYLKLWDDSSSNPIIFGNGSGFCNDGVTPLSCKTNISDVFVSAAGKFYWNEIGLIRTLDSSGNVITIAGQTKFYGDNGKPLDARFGQIKNIVTKSNGNIVLLDGTNLRIREFDRASSSMKLLAGNNSNSVPNTTALANTQSIRYDVWIDSATIGLNTSTDEVIYNRGNAIAKISSAGKWVDLAGNGATSYQTADGLGLGVVKVQASFTPKVIGVNGSTILAALGTYSSGFIDGMLKTYSIASGVQSTFAGLVGVAGGAWPSDTATLSTSLFPHSTYVGAMSYDSFNSNWIAYTGGNSIKTLTQGSTILNLFTDTGTTSIRAVTISRASGNLIVYYCALVGSNYQLKKWDQSTPGTFSTLSWPSTSISCLTNGLAYDNSSNKLIFSFQSNGLQGIAEYLNP